MTTLAQRSFAGGEIAPALYARCDTVKYATGVRTLRNFFVMRHGGASSRAGTTYVAQSSSSTPVRLIPFVFNTSQTYVLEFGHRTMRVYKNGVQLTDTSTAISAITNANPAVITATGHGLIFAAEVQISGILGAIGSRLNNRNFIATPLTANTLSLAYLDGTLVNSTTFGSYASGGTVKRVYQLASAYDGADLPLLKFVQSADVITITHPSYFVNELKRFGDTNWTLSAVTFAPGIAAPTGLSGTGPGSGSLTISYVVTALATDTLEESLASTAATAGFATFPTASSPVNLSWTAVSGASQYNVYRALNGVYGFIGVAGSNSFTDIGAGADTSSTPPTDTNPFATENPSTVAYFQQRLSFGCTNSNPETIWCSRSGKFKNFSISTPLQDDDSIKFRLIGRQVNSIKHMIDVGKMLVFTSGGEWAMNGDASGTLTPTAINPKQYTYNGASDVRPIIIDNTVLYVQARGSIVRDLAFDFQIDGYKGNDLTIFSSHLVKGRTITDWTYCQTPESIVWAVRDDGVLLALTYVREQQILAWHRHDMDGGKVESVCSVPEGSEDVLYLAVSRTVNGASVRHIERMSSRIVGDIIDYNGIDCSLLYDGRALSGSVTLSGGTTWDYTETLNLTASSGIFVSTDIGNAVFIYTKDSNGNVTDVLRCTISAYTSATVVSVSANKTVPVGLRGIASSTFAKAVDQVTGLWHLEGKEVSVFADGFVVGNPNNPDYTTYTVTNGSITLDEPYAVIRVGLPMICDVETLDIDTPQGPSLADKKMSVGRVTVFVEDSSTFWVGPKPPTDDSVDPLENLTELKLRQYESMDETTELVTDKVDINIMTEWNSNGRVFIRHIDPTPLTILEIAPAGLMPIGR